MATNTAHALQSSEADESPEIQSDAPPAKEEIYWATLLQKTRQAAYQHVERYVDSQHAHIQASDTDPFSRYLSFCSASYAVWLIYDSSGPGSGWA